MRRFARKFDRWCWDRLASWAVPSGACRLPEHPRRRT